MQTLLLNPGQSLPIFNNWKNTTHNHAQMGCTDARENLYISSAQGNFEIKF